jgi:hypothetical protein
MLAVTIAAFIAVIPLFAGSFFLGTSFIPKLTPAQLMYVWDGLLVAFLFFWVIGLVTELQRYDPLSLSKFLHLPVSVNGAFLINYLSSLVRLSLIVFGPVMLGFSLALVYVKGVRLLPVLPLVAAFLLMVTALTYQFQGWLAALMSNPRRRRTIVVVITMLFVLVFQLPNLFNAFAPWGVQRQVALSTELKTEMEKLDRSFQAHEFEAPEVTRRQKELLDRHRLASQKALNDMKEYWINSVWLINNILPVGWLPLGVMSAAEGRFLPWVLGLAGMTLIGALSLRRAYRTTVGLYQGVQTARKARPERAKVSSTAPKRGGLLLEARVPGCSDPVSAIALGGFRSLLRSPEAKMAILTPVIINVAFGSMLLSARHTFSESVRTLVAIGGMVFVLLGVINLTSNQFGFDRDGFRVFVLSAASRRDILLGKNLAHAPVVLGMGAIVLVVVQLLSPMRWDHFLSMFPQFVSMFLIFFIFTNVLSILVPFYIPPGSLHPSNPKLTTVLLQMAMFLVLFPLTQAITLFPLGAEVLLGLFGWGNGVPVCLLLSLAECAAAIVLYNLALGRQGRWFQAREQRILETVTNKAR